MSRKHKVGAYLDDSYQRWDSFFVALGKGYRREVEISEYVKVNKRQTVLDKFVTTSGALLK